MFLVSPNNCEIFVLFLKLNTLADEVSNSLAIVLDRKKPNKRQLYTAHLHSSNKTQCPIYGGHSINIFKLKNYNSTLLINYVNRRYVPRRLQLKQIYLH